jgi:hypothetical protein
MATVYPATFRADIYEIRAVVSYHEAAGRIETAAAIEALLGEWYGVKEYEREYEKTLATMTGTGASNGQ